ncbi:MAG: AbrB/MazE/SpoVT family DNA-binding domain-containing protein, partial [Methanophagales archaeon]|nr:AbrB/MazE/SpoVT family DNA-binding domain-containing protein [Methanophagales archaeon]
GEACGTGIEGGGFWINFIFLEVIIGDAKMLVKVSSKGLITLPKQIREEFGIDKGDYLAVSAEGGKIVFQKVKMEIDWENSDDVWKEYAAKKLAD